MLLGMAGGAQRNGVAITRFDPDATIGSSAHMRGLRRRGSAASDARELTDKSQVLHPPTQVRLGFAARYDAWDAGCWHRFERISGCLSSGAVLVHGTVPRLARSAAFNANPPCGTGTSVVARIFSMTRSAE